MTDESFQPAGPAAWRDWLAQNHSSTSGVWLVLDKKAAGKIRLTYEQAVEEALCWGWIDSVAHGVDEVSTKLRFSPRKKGSGWAATNKARLEKLLAEGRVAPVALEQIEAAKKDGSWSKLDSAQNRTVPDDLLAELAKYPDARRYFDAFPAGEKRRILEWIAQAKTEPTRRKRVEETARLASQNVRANLWARPL